MKPLNKAQQEAMDAIAAECARTESLGVGVGVCYVYNEYLERVTQKGDVYYIAISRSTFNALVGRRLIDYTNPDRHFVKLIKPV